MDDCHHPERKYVNRRRNVLLCEGGLAAEKEIFISERPVDLRKEIPKTDRDIVTMCPNTITRRTE
jgi:hypothetical protein